MKRVHDSLDRNLYLFQKIERSFLEDPFLNMYRIYPASRIHKRTDVIIETDSPYFTLQSTEDPNFFISARKDGRIHHLVLRSKDERHKLVPFRYLKLPYHCILRHIIEIPLSRSRDRNLLLALQWMQFMQI